MRCPEAAPLSVVAERSRLNHHLSKCRPLTESSGRTGREPRLVLVVADQVPVGSVPQRAINGDADLLAQEPDRAIAEDEVAASRMPAAEPAHELRFSQLRQDRGLVRGEGCGRHGVLLAVGGYAVQSLPPRNRIVDQRSGCSWV